ncbi:MAG: LamG domain-containing protein [Phycisphaerae bacterium]
MIDYQNLPSPSFRTPMDALRAMFFYMKEGRPAEWRAMWADGKDPLASVSDAKLQRAWEHVFAEPHYLLYEIRYRGQTIYVTERGAGRPRSRAKFFFKETADGWRPNSDLYVQDKDPFARVVDSSNFDPVTGVRSAEPTALYQFETLEPRVEVVDSSTCPFLDPKLSHSINNGTGVNVVSGEGVKGKALVLDGTGYVTLPPSVPLSIYNNRFTLGLWVKTEGVPRKPENDAGGDYYAATILSRGEPDVQGHLALEIREPKSAGGGAVLFLQVGAGADALTRQTPFPVGQWVLIEVAYDHGYLRLKVDGKEVTGSTAEAGAPAPKVTAPFARFVLGRRQTEPFCPFVGSLDEFSISNEVAK